MAEMRGAFEVHEMPNGSVCFYRDSDHSYYGEIKQKGEKWTAVRDSRLPSPSTIGKLLETSNEGLLRWAAKQTCRGVIELRGQYPEDPDALWGRLVSEKLTYSDLRQKRADEGTNVHEKVLGCLAAGERIPSLSDVLPEERGFSQGIFAAWHDLDPEPIASEFVVYSTEHQFAGRVDLLCKVDGRLTLLDLKTGFVGNGAHTQLAGYDLACREAGYGDPEETVILKVDSDGSYFLIPCAAVDEDFTNALSAYRSASQVGKRSRELAKAA